MLLFAAHAAGVVAALALTPREAHAPLPNLGAVALRQVGDELVGVGRPSCRHDLLECGVWVSVGDVFGDAAREEDRLLQDHGKLLA